MTGEGTTVTQAARILKISRSTAYAALRQHAPAALPQDRPGAMMGS
jgi:transposase